MLAYARVDSCTHIHTGGCVAALVRALGHTHSPIEGYELRFDVRTPEQQFANIAHHVSRFIVASRLCCPLLTELIKLSSMQFGLT